MSERFAIQFKSTISKSYSYEYDDRFITNYSDFQRLKRAILDRNFIKGKNEFKLRNDSILEINEELKSTIFGVFNTREKKYHLFKTGSDSGGFKLKINEYKYCDFLILKIKKDYFINHFFISLKDSYSNLRSSFFDKYLKDGSLNRHILDKLEKLKKYDLNKFFPPRIDDSIYVNNAKGNRSFLKATRNDSVLFNDLTMDNELLKFKSDFDDLFNIIRAYSLKLDRKLIHKIDCVYVTISKFNVISLSISYRNIYYVNDDVLNKLLVNAPTKDVFSNAKDYIENDVIKYLDGQFGIFTKGIKWINLLNLLDVSSRKLYIFPVGFNKKYSFVYYVAFRYKDIPINISNEEIKVVSFMYNYLMLLLTYKYDVENITMFYAAKANSLSSLSNKMLNYRYDNQYQMFNNLSSYSDIENLFVNNNFICYGSINPLFNACATEGVDNTYLKTIFFNHIVRYRSLDNYKNIVTMTLYNLLMWHTYMSFTFALNFIIEETRFTFLKAIIVNRYNYMYGKIIIVYPTTSSFSNSDNYNRIYLSISKCSIASNIEIDIRKISEILWQNSNSTNGLYIPICSFVISLLGFLIALSISPSSIIDKPWKFLLGFILCFSSIFIAILFIKFLSKSIPKQNIRIRKHRK